MALEGAEGQLFFGRKAKNFGDFGREW